MIRQRTISNIAAALGLAVLLLSATGCARPDHFAGIFTQAGTVEQAAAALTEPTVETLPDGSLLYSWNKRDQNYFPAHYEWIRRGWDREGYPHYDYVWFPDRMEVRECQARIIAAPDGRILSRSWQGNACADLIKNFPAWYDKNNPANPTR